MSILIKGMEMPTSSPVCIVIDAVGQVRHYDLNNDRYADNELFEANYIPPHGRVIDGDALEAVVEAHYKHLKISRYDRDLLLHYLDVEMAPTIIPAEK